MGSTGPVRGPTPLLERNGKHRASPLTNTLHGKELKAWDQSTDQHTSWEGMESMGPVHEPTPLLERNGKHRASPLTNTHHGKEWKARGQSIDQHPSWKEMGRALEVKWICNQNGETRQLYNICLSKLPATTEHLNVANFFSLCTQARQRRKVAATAFG